LYRGGIPKLSGTWQWNAETKQVVIELRQTQPGAPFRFPIEFGITPMDGPALVKSGEVTAGTARFSFAVEREPTSVTIDPNVRLLFDGALVRR
jgi:aminopeptidase N